MAIEPDYVGFAGFCFSFFLLRKIFTATRMFIIPDTEKMWEGWGCNSMVEHLPST